jgi:cyclopropane fatty-acyl-phospholipid synthase-like methyltransferase
VNEFVREGYDRIAEAYATQRDTFKSLPYLERFAAMLPPGGRVLDIGCGAGLPAARYLVEHGFGVTGIDISPRMVELARKNVPAGVFEVRDLLSLQHAEYAVAGIVALYSVFHVSRDEHESLFRVLRSYLREGGALLVTMGADEWEGTETDFHGTQMFWSHFGSGQNRELVETAGFRIEADEIDTSGGERHQVLLGRAR